MPLGNCIKMGSCRPSLWTDPALDMGSLHYHVGRDVAVVIGATRAKPSRLD
jgi:hypothetical protein